MGWLKNSVQDIKEATAADPIDCPRGWGDVAFVVHMEGLPPLGTISRRCPIAGVANCGACRYPFNPETAEKLRQALDELGEMYDEGVLSESEYQARRRMVVTLQHGAVHRPGDTPLIVAWILAPLGAVMGGAGAWLANTFHLAFWGLAGVGAILVALAASFGGIAYMKRQDLQRMLDEDEFDRKLMV